MSASTRIALFDIDGTLFSGQTYAHVFGQLWKQSWRRLRIAFLLAGSLPSQALYKAGLVDRVKSQERWSEKVAWFLRGANTATVSALMHETWLELRPLLRDEVVTELERRRREGYVVILASAAVTPIVEGLANLVQVDGLVGTPLEVRNGRYAGKVAGPLASGEQKLEYALRLPILRDCTVDWDNSYAYSDSIFDLAMLERVGHPVAVWPDQELAAAARAGEWPVLGE